MRYCAAVSKTYRLCFRFHNPDFHRLPLPREAFLFLPAVIHVQKVSLYSPQSVQYHRYQIHTLTLSSTVGAALHPVSYTHLRAHETDSYLVCRLLLEKKKLKKKKKKRAHETDP